MALALDSLEAVGAPAPVPPMTLQVQYRSMAFLGDAIRPVVYTSEGDWDVDLAGESGDTLALVRIRKR